MSTLSNLAKKLRESIDVGVDNIKSGVKLQTTQLPGYSGDQVGFRVGSNFIRVGTAEPKQTGGFLDRVAGSARAATSIMPDSATHAIRSAVSPISRNLVSQELPGSSGLQRGFRVGSNFVRLGQAANTDPSRVLGEFIGGISQNTSRGIANIASGVKKRNPLQIAGGGFQVATPFLSATSGLGTLALNTGIGAAMGAVQGNPGKGAAEGFNLSAVTRFTNPATDWTMRTVIDPKSSFVARQVGKRLISGAANVLEDRIINRAAENGNNSDLYSFVLGALTGGNDDIFESMSKKQISRTPSPVTTSGARELVRTTKQGMRYKQEIGKGGFRKVQYLDIPAAGGGKLAVDGSDPLRMKRAGKTGETLLRDGNIRDVYGAAAGFEPEYDEDGKLKGFKFNPTRAAAGMAVVGGIRAVGDADIPEGGAKQLRDLLYDPTRLLKLGYSKAQVDLIGAKEARRILENNILPFEHQSFQTAKDVGARFENAPIKTAQRVVRQFQPTEQEVAQTVGDSLLSEMEKPQVARWFNSIFSPIKNAPKQVQDIMQSWRSSTIASQARANEVAQLFSDIPEQDGWKLVRFMQNPTNRSAVELNLDVEKYGPQMQRLRSFYDTTRQEGIDAGLDIHYLDNYLNQVWRETPNQIEAKIKAGAGRIPGFAKERRIPSYDEGIKLGLTPSFTHPAQLAAHYRVQLDKALANRKMVDQLVATQMLLPATDAPPTWRTINSPFFPKVKVDFGKGEAVLMDYKAPPDIAKALNNVFEIREPDVLGKVASISKGIQEIALTGGIPGTPINSFSMANLQKEVMAGRIRGPMAASAMSLSDSSSRGYFRRNRQAIEELAGQGVRIFGNDDYRTLYKNMAENKNFASAFFGGARRIFDSAFNEPTFRRFMPILQVEFYKDAYKSAVNGGIDHAQAQSVAALATKNFYGIADAFSRSSKVEDSMSSLLMAPGFREAMINFWGNTIKSIDPRTFKDPAFAANRKFIVGAAVTFGIYNVMNKALTGRWMHENKEGKELSLEIPLGNGRSFYTPFLFTIATAPRRVFEAAGNLKSGDIAGAAERLGTFSSIPLQNVSSILSNRTFYDAPIYDNEKDAPAAKLAKLAGYGLEQMSPGPIGGLISVAQGRKTIKEAIPSLVELPLYPSASSDVAHLSGKQTDKYKELFAANPASAAAYSEKVKSGSSVNEAKNTLKKSIQPKEQGFIDRMFNKQPEAITTDTLSTYFGLGEYDLLPEGSAMERAQKAGKKREIVTSILRDEDVFPEQKVEVLSRLGENIDLTDIEYYKTASLDNSIKLGYVTDYLASVPAKERGQALILLTQEINGERILAPGVVESLVKQRMLTKNEAQVLKVITYDRKTGRIVKKSTTTTSKKANVKGVTPSVKIPNMRPAKATISAGNAKLPSVRTQSARQPVNAGGNVAAQLQAAGRVQKKPISYRQIKIRVPVA